ncbi:MAG: Na+/H+ antiporter NhaA [Flavobacterium sp.]|jgi:NhaA family Na+:H+ antiporter|nr:Na+/H+ antiporter NhaA [Flavobacterium sp.]
MKETNLFKAFFESEKAGGFVLIFATLISLLLANSIFQSEYLQLWNNKIGNHSLVEWINDGLMTIFFLLIGLELEREVYIGELSTLKKAALPLIGAIGGMIIPALIYAGFNLGTTTQSGIGIPMATDIAFAIGILSLLGSRVPTSLKVFLTALAVIDDLGAIFVIAVFYTSSISLMNLGIALGILALLFILNRLKVNNIIPYLIGGILMWYFMLNSGVHATITGVLLAFVIPFGDGKKKSISYQLQHYLHQPVAFLILPLFALANTCIVLNSNWYEGLSHSNSIGIILGLFIGKPIGIWLFSYLGVLIGIGVLPKSLNWNSIFGAAILGGIGFTMSIFISLLAFDNNSDIINSKIAILIASTIAAITGFIYLKVTLKRD